MPKRVESLVETLKQPANLVVKHFEIRHASTVLRAKILATAVALALKANDDLPEKGADFIASIKKKKNMIEEIKLECGEKFNEEVLYLSYYFSIL
ncbi:hypothetical protein NC651_031252 [Populus alba x Populus x berolinensis]|nr:hypothetical protein NC651_031252 [Populus alba x Populus x berolinensis]